MGTLVAVLVLGGVPNRVIDFDAGVGVVVISRVPPPSSWKNLLESDVHQSFGVNPF